jgi:hypothetical protein
MADAGEEGNAAAPRGSARRRGFVRASLDADELIALMHGSDPVRVELTRLENELRGDSRWSVRAVFVSFLSRRFFYGLTVDGKLHFSVAVCSIDKERELGEAQAEIRALRLSERAREKAVEEVIACMALKCGSFLCLSFGGISIPAGFCLKWCW